MNKNCKHPRVIIKEQASEIICLRVEDGNVIYGWSEAGSIRDVIEYECDICGLEVKFGSLAKKPAWVINALRAHPHFELLQGSEQ